MNILCLCPAGFASGGPETLHKLVSDLNNIKEVNAKLLYKGKNLDNPQPEAYKDYAAPYVTELPKDFKGIVILPEIWANKINNPEYEGCKKVIFWLSVDNYRRRVSKEDEGLCMKDDRVLHIVQSLYVEEYIRGLGAKKVFSLSEPVNDEFFKPYEEVERSDVILYNPNKMTEFQRKLMKEAEVYEGLKFEPLKGLTTQQMAEKLRTHKLYIDFGPFPGRERIPREAVLCGCCIITGKNGASRHFSDVSILNKYKFDSTEDFEKIISTMKHILSYYNMCKKDYDYFREVLEHEKAELSEREKALVEVLNEI